MVVAAVVHGELLSLDAFAPASGVVARAAVRLTLIERGLDLKSLVVIEAGHRDLGDAYDDALAAYRSGTAEGVGQWVCGISSEAAVVGARESLADLRGADPKRVTGRRRRQVIS